MISLRKNLLKKRSVKELRELCMKIDRLYILNIVNTLHITSLFLRLCNAPGVYNEGKFQFSY